MARHGDTETAPPQHPDTTGDASGGSPSDAATPAPLAPGASQTLAATDFANDRGARSVREAFVNYVQRVRGGEMGILPALGGLIVLVVIFANLSDVFLSKTNFANLLIQAAPIALLAMGLVFVLLLGEIDLSAGTASGVAAALMGLALTKHGDLQTALGTPVYLIVLLGMLAAVAVSVWLRLWVGGAVILAAGLLMLSPWDQYALGGIAVAIGVGAAIGTLVGILVAKIGIPSFIVTLALFLGWQGVILKFIGEGGAIDARQNSFIFDISNSNFSPLVGWLIWAIAVAGYAAYTLGRALRQRAAGLTAEPLAVVGIRAIALILVTGAGVWLLNADRSKTVFATIQGVPKVVLVVLALLVLWTLVLTKTRFGRHLYAVGGNAEAARRAGIDVLRIKVAAFVISSSMAAIAGIALASKLGSIPTDFGGKNTLLYAVAAAVIGGTSLFGGKGKARDAVIGGLVLAIIPNGLGLLTNIDASYELMITAAVLLLAATVDALSRKRSASR